MWLTWAVSVRSLSKITPRSWTRWDGRLRTATQKCMSAADRSIQAEGLLCRRSHDPTLQASLLSTHRTKTCRELKVVWQTDGQTDRHTDSLLQLRNDALQRFHWTLMIYHFQVHQLHTQTYFINIHNTYRQTALQCLWRDSVTLISTLLLTYLLTYLPTQKSATLS